MPIPARRDVSIISTPAIIIASTLIVGMVMASLVFVVLVYCIPFDFLASYRACRARQAVEKDKALRQVQLEAYLRRSCAPTDLPPITVSHPGPMEIVINSVGRVPPNSDLHFRNLPCLTNDIVMQNKIICAEGEDERRQLELEELPSSLLSLSPDSASSRSSIETTYSRWMLRTDQEVPKRTPAVPLIRRLLPQRVREDESRIAPLKLTPVGGYEKVDGTFRRVRKSSEPLKLEAKDEGCVSPSPTVGDYMHGRGDFAPKSKISKHVRFNTASVTVKSKILKHGQDTSQDSEAESTVARRVDNRTNSPITRGGPPAHEVATTPTDTIPVPPTLHPVAGELPRRALERPSQATITSSIYSSNASIQNASPMAVLPSHGEVGQLECEDDGEWFAVGDGEDKDNNAQPEETEFASVAEATLKEGVAAHLRQKELERRLMDWRFSGISMTDSE